MGYVLTEVYDAALLAEREYIRNVPEVLFSKFTSCIGVAVRTGVNLTAIHLVQVADDWFDRIAAQRVLDVLGNGYDEACIFGCVDDWRLSLNAGIRNGYELLTARFATLRIFQTYSTYEGFHGVAISEGRILISKHWEGDEKQSSFLPMKN